MSTIDSLLQHTPGVIAKGLKGRNEGDQLLIQDNDRRRQREIQESQVRRQIERDALEMSLRQAAERRDAELHPYSIKEAMARARSTDALAQDRLRPPEPKLDPRDIHAANRRFDIANPLPDRGRGADGLADTQREQRAVGQQIDDTRSDLARAEREGVPKMTRPLYLPPAKEAGFVADSTRAANKIKGLQHRSDSLTAVNDRLVSRMSDGDSSTPRPSFGDVRGGGSSSQAQRGDVEGLRAQARDAIERGAPPDQVRARFRKLTGQDY